MELGLAVALILLILFSAFFSGSETALIGSQRVKLSQLAEEGDRGAQRVFRLIRKPSDLLATILVGNNLVNVSAAAVATVLVGPVYATILVTILLLVFSEIAPKTLAAHIPEKVAAWVSAPVALFGIIFKPIVWVVTGICNLLLWPFLGGQRTKERRMSRKDLLTTIRLGARDGVLEPAETRMTREILELKDKPIESIMIPLKDVDGISESASLEEVMQEIAKTSNTRYPIYRNDISDMIGILLVKELLLHREGVEENWRKYVRPLVRCRADLEADELLRDMQIQRFHMAAVEDAAGKVIGIVTMEDVLEEIFGEIQDEFDEEEQELIHEYNAGRYTVHGSVEVDDLCKVINIDLGQSDQHMTFGEWYSKQSTSEIGRTSRVRKGNIRIMQRPGNRYDVLVKRQSF
jgi:CBS domain containing-hemolysin-like protein